MIDLKTIIDLLKPPVVPPYPNSVTSDVEELPHKGLTMGTLFIGRPGTGKTTALARHIVEYFVLYPERAIFVLDWSGSISDEILKLILKYPKEIREKLLKRLVYDELGNPEYVVPLPEFSDMYGGTIEEQVQRVTNNLHKLSGTLVTDAPVVGGLSIKELGPQIFRLVCVIRNEFGESFQVTEVKRLLMEEAVLRNALANYGKGNLEAMYYLQKVFLPQSDRDKDMKRYALVSMLGLVEPKEAKARLGFYKPGWTPKEAIEKGLMVIVDGARMITQRPTQHYLFTQAYSLILAEINKRRPANPEDHPVSLVMDEVYSLLSIPGMAEEVGMLSPLYRSRKLELYIVLQALSQLAKPLDRQIWSLGNIVSFAIADFNEAYEIAQQVFRYVPEDIKLPAKGTGQPIVEPDRGQYLQIANTIQRMPHRQCIVRRYMSEKVLDKNVLWVPVTKNIPTNPIEENVNEVRESLVRSRGVKIRDALEIIGRRTVEISGNIERRTFGR